MKLLRNIILEISGLLLRAEINWWLTKSLVAKWDITCGVFQFGSIKMCPTIEEYSRILGVHCDIGSIVTPSLDKDFKLRTQNPS